jgi:hypothetical protein
MPRKTERSRSQPTELKRARFESISNAFEGRLRDYERKGLGGLMAAYAIGLPSLWYYVHSTGDDSVIVPAYWLAAAQIVYLIGKRIILSREAAHLRRLHQDLTASGASLVLTNSSRGRNAQLARKAPDDTPERVVSVEALASVRAYGRFLRRTEL